MLFRRLNYLVKLVVHICKQWPTWINMSVADIMHQQIHMLALFVKHHGNWILGAPYLILPPTISYKVWQILHPYILYMMNDILSMLKRLNSATAVFVFGPLDPIFPCVAAMHTWRINWKDYVMIFFSIYLKPFWHHDRDKISRSSGHSILRITDSGHWVRQAMYSMDELWMRQQS